MLTPTIRSKVDALWDKFWSGGIANPLTAIEQISYLLFMRRLDAMDEKRRQDAEFVGRPFKSLFVEHGDCRWSSFKHLPADEMLNHLRDKVFPFVKKLGGESEPFAKSMQDAVFIIPKPSLLVEAVGIIDEIYTEMERDRSSGGSGVEDPQGDLYEYLLSEISTAGKNGQFRTPRHIIEMICALVDPKLGDEICDPACGTAGFLLGAYAHILTQHTSPGLRKLDDAGLERGLAGDRLTDERQWQVLRGKTFYGFDFDTTMVRIGLMNLLLHGIERPNISYRDTLSKKYDEKERYDVILATPPFKGSIDKGDIHEDLRLKTTKTELLFVNRIIDMLRIGGRASVIVPDGVLFGSSNAHRDLRQMLIDECELQAVISMPAGIFRPYAGVSTAVLVFVKGAKTENVWFYDMEADGYSLDDKRDKIAGNDIPDIVAQWRMRASSPSNDRAGKAFLVTAAEIRQNRYDLSINRYKEVRYEEVYHESPKEVLTKLRDLEDHIRADLVELEKMLG